MRGEPTGIDDQARIAHEKAMVIDEAVVLTGSYNWTRGAAENSEDLNLISSPTVAMAYAAHWHNRLAISVPFDRSESWCRFSSAETRCRRQPSDHPGRAIDSDPARWAISRDARCCLRVVSDDLADPPAVRLAPTDIDHMHAWSMALDLTYAHGWLIAKVASALLQRRELDGDEFLDLSGAAGS
jgi:hypothetical protein